MTTTFPKPVRRRNTPGSQRLADYTERTGTRPVAWYVPTVLHEALVELAARTNLSLQFMLTHACEVRYGHDDPAKVDIPPLVPPTRLTQDPHKNVTWYAPLALHKKIKFLALQIDATAQQLITSAVVDQYKGTKEIKALRITTGSAPYSRAPVLGNLSLQRPPPKDRQ